MYDFTFLFSFDISNSQKEEFMLKFRNYHEVLLYDMTVSKENRVEITELKEGEKPSILSDTMFKTMFFSF